MAEAIEALAATLAVHGYWLPQDMFPVPGPALMVARNHGRDLSITQVVWS